MDLLGLDHRQQRRECPMIGELSAKPLRFDRRLRCGRRCREEEDRHHSAKLPSSVRHTGLRQRCLSLSASRTAASSMSTPSPGPSGTGKKPPTGVSACLLVQKFKRSCPPVL